ncbi:hypothetical protein M404DRAFT_19832 [Pisolithus tinctorius Marx 270]|uniref:Uncharacterized protein n=1 Tax=Pisolithus tinctorius Marx 270 TaxID=870435 RepID=A0A0C3PDZ8_PISTI|nr:hypothetical protein M404DRAFT_19832 [Pisolithus tinctorius Marx 270]
MFARPLRVPANPSPSPKPLPLSPHHRLWNSSPTHSPDSGLTGCLLACRSSPAFGFLSGSVRPALPALYLQF